MIVPYLGPQPRRLFCKVADVPVGALVAQLESRPDLWDQHTRRRDVEGSPHSGMSDIWVRYRDAAPFEASGDWTGFNDEHIPIWYPAFAALPALQPIIFELMAVVRGEMLCGVLITRSGPGHKIARHTDDGWHTRYARQFFVTLTNATGADFWGEDEKGAERVEPRPGEVWMFDSLNPHWVENNTAEAKLTLIVCIRTHAFDGTPWAARIAPGGS